MNKFSEVWKRQSVYSTTEETTKAQDWFLIRTDGFEHSRWPTRKEAEEMCEQLHAQGIYGTIIRESVVGDTTKARETEDNQHSNTEDNVTKHNGDEINFAVEYKDKYGHTNHRFFNHKDQLDQFKDQMGSEVTITRMFKDILVQKPGESRHSEKWDRCVKEVEAKGTGNAYAICTAEVGEESFKSGEFNVMEIDRFLDVFGKQVGVEYAGPAPQSLLSRQDLEGKKKAVDDSDDDTVTKAFKGFTPTYELAARIKANQKLSIKDITGKSFKDLWSKVRSTNTYRPGK